MGCNAWNHPINCSCGWGGDRGGSGGQGNIRYRPLQVVDGFTWRIDRKPTYDSYVNPNASCPVCGAAVYYYQSPYGGRVFFDDLGPPWPKHGCTDSSRPSTSRAPAHSFIVGPKEIPLAKTLPFHARNAWRPLLSEEFANAGEFDRFRIPQRERAPGRFMYVPSGWTGHAPAFWRWSQANLGMIEVSCFKLSADGSLVDEIFVVPGSLNGDEEFSVWRMQPNAAITPETLNSIGFGMSFAWRDPKMNQWHRRFPGVDLELARACFERAAEDGYWAALNNLGVMYRDGIGVESDPVKAFGLFQQAAQSLELIPLRHLANCYRQGIGCDPNSDYSAFLEELLTIREEEQKAAAA